MLQNKFKNIKKNQKLIIFTITFILFLLLTYIMFNNRINNLDTYVHSLILNIRNDVLTKTMILITNISSAYSLIAISLLLLIIQKNKKKPFLISINLLTSFILSQIVKIIIQRPRPIGINLIEESGFSYPSGHSLVSMAYFGLLAYLIYKSSKKKATKILLIITFLITSILIGFSRIYLGVHYLSDVIAGFLLSIAYLMVFINLTKSFYEKVK